MSNSQQWGDHTKLNYDFLHIIIRSRHTCTSLVCVAPFLVSVRPRDFLLQAWFCCSSVQLCLPLSNNKPRWHWAGAASSLFNNQGRSEDHWGRRCWGEDLLTPRRRSRRRRRRWAEFMRYRDVPGGSKLTFSQEIFSFSQKIFSFSQIFFLIFSEKFLIFSTSSIYDPFFDPWSHSCLWWYFTVVVTTLAAEFSANISN